MWPDRGPSQGEDVLLPHGFGTHVSTHGFGTHTHGFGTHTDSGHTRIRDTQRIDGFGTHTHGFSSSSTDPGHTRAAEYSVSRHRRTEYGRQRPRSDGRQGAFGALWRHAKTRFEGSEQSRTSARAARDQSGTMDRRAERRVPPQPTRVFIADGQTGDSRWQGFLPRLQSTPPSPVEQTLPRPVGALSPTKHCQPRRRPARPRRRRCIERAG